MYELMDNLQYVKCVSFGRYLGPADVEIMLINVPVIGWILKQFLMTLTLNRWIQIDIARCAERGITGSTLVLAGRGNSWSAAGWCICLSIITRESAACWSLCLSLISRVWFLLSPWLDLP